MAKLLRKVAPVASAVLALGLATASAAAVIIDPSPGGIALKIDKGKDLASSSGTYGSNTVDIAVVGNGDFANGNATIKPSGTPLLVTLTFTPDIGNFDAFSTRGQDLKANQVITISGTDNVGGVFSWDFDIAKANQDFSRIGVTEDAAGLAAGDYITSLTVTNLGGFKEAKQFQFGALADRGGGGGGVPEPATWAMLLLGLGGIGATLRSRRRQDFAAI